MAEITKYIFLNFSHVGYIRPWHLLFPVTAAVIRKAPSSRYGDALRKYRKLTSPAAYSRSAGPTEVQKHLFLLQHASPYIRNGRQCSNHRYSGFPGVRVYML